MHIPYIERNYRQRTIEEKIYRRRRKKRKTTKVGNQTSKFDSQGSVRSFFTKFLQQLDHAGFINKKYIRRKIYAPERFSFKEDYDKSIVFFKEIISTYILSDGALKISFKKCKLSSIANFSLLDVLLANLKEITIYYNRSKYCVFSKSLKIDHSDYDIKTNKYLHSFLNVLLPPLQDDGSHYLKMPLQKGRQKNFQENMKTRVSTIVVDFVNKSTEEAGATLKLKGRRAIEGLMGEVLGNAEDHSVPNSYWYVDAISFVEQQNNTDVVDLNLAIINVGPSMYEGFEATKKDNFDNYNKCQALYNLHKSQFTIFNTFERESLFSMYLLNDGISRLKYTDASRGNGTIRFLESFLVLGSFGKTSRKFQSQLNVISGHTILTCDNDIHSFRENDINILSLNKEQNIKKLPDKSHLSYNQEYFPGTILECHIFLNKDYFDQKIKKNEKNSIN